MQGSTQADRAASSRWLTGRMRSARRTLRRSLGLEPNPLLRRSDRVEARARAAALLLIAAAVPVAVGVAALARDHLTATASHQAAARHPYSATVVDDPHLSAARSVVVTTARVAWTGPAGETHEASTLTPAGTSRGDRMTVWATQDGEITSPPLSGRDVLALSGLSVAGLLLGVAIVTAVLLGALRWSLDRSRYRAWDAEWAVVDTAGRR